MLMKMLFLAVLLAPSASLAADDAPTTPLDGSEKDICSAIGIDRVRCEQAFTLCTWDPVDAICASSPHILPCARIVNPAACRIELGCFWDKGDPLGPRCEPLS